MPTVNNIANVRPIAYAGGIRIARGHIVVESWPELSLHGGQPRIVAHIASRNRLDEAARHAYLLFERLSREVSRSLYSGPIG